MNFTKKLFLSLGSALLMVAAWPERGFPLFIFIAWIPLFLLSDYFLKNKHEKFFPWIYLSFLVFNLLLTYWIWFATPVGAVIAITINSLLMALIFSIWHALRKRLPHKMAWAAFPALWISFEKMHFEWDLEWPWLTMGNVFATHPEWIQWYEYTGVFGGTLWILLVNIRLYHFFKRKKKNGWIVPASLLLIPLLFSLIKYYSYEEKGEIANVLILQPNIDPWTEKFNRPNEENMADLIKLAEKYADSVQLIIAPETALADAIDKDRISHERFYPLLKNFRHLHPRTDWLTGASLYRFLPPGIKKIPSTANKTSSGNWYQLYNSALYYKDNPLPEMYHKKILVVGAEKMPFHRFLSPLIGDLVLNLGGATGTHTPSREPVVFTSSDGKIKLGAVICYESVFGNYVRKFVLKKANLLAVITNDGWWKKTGGYRQHFHYARLRAIENRRDIVRSANTGRSGHINQRGDIVASLEYGRRGALKVKPHLNEAITFYTKYGDIIARMAIFTFILLFLYALGKKRTDLFL